MVQNQRSLTRLNRSCVSAFIIVLWVLVAHLGAISQFTRGFLLTRPVLPYFSNTTSVAPESAPFERAVVLIVDALRYDFVVSGTENTSLPFLNNFPVEELSSNPANAFALKFMADPPTTTLQRLKGLTTGSLPAFVDAGSNFNGYAIEEDNWVHQAAKHLGAVSFVGDDTWESLFSTEFSENYPFPSLNVRDLDTVDNGVKAHLPRMLANQTNKIIIGHMLGVDHVGHRYGPSHPAMAAKLRETFDFVKEIANSIDDKTVLIVMGDHGMDSTGNHGGDSQSELEAALFMYSKRAAFRKSDKTTVNQVDFVPTISGLLGLPIPYNSLGFPIYQAFNNKKQWKKLCAATVRQIAQYAESLGVFSGKEDIEALMSSGDVDALFAYQSRTLEHFKEAWAQFDTTAMLNGILLLCATVLMLAIIHNSSRASTLGSIARYQTLGGLVGFLMCSIVQLGERNAQLVDRLISFAVYTGTVSVVFGIFGSAKLWRWDTPSKWSFFAVAILGVEFATSFSNSYVIWESSITHYLIVMVFLVLAASCAKQGSPLVMYLGGWCCAVSLVVIRLCSCWHVCREETASSCVTTFFLPHSSLVPLWTYFAIGVLGFAFPYFLKRFWAIGQNNVGLANLIVSMTSFALMLTITYASLDNAEARGWLSADMRGLQTLKVLLGRFAMAVGMLGLFIWWNGNPPFDISFAEKGHRILGFSNIYGADALLPVVCLFWSIAVTNKPPGILSLAGLLYVSMCTLDFMDITTTKYTLLMPVIFDLIGHSFFYFTGHQATIPSIQWDSAFVASSGVSYPWSPVTVILNTMGPVIITTLVCVLCSIWRRTVFTDCRLPVAFVVRAIMGLTLVTSVRTIASMIASFLLRRHLMAWKIFAPRFMFGGLSLLATDVTCLVAVVLVSQTIRKVTAIFG